MATYWVVTSVYRGTESHICSGLYSTEEEAKRNSLYLSNYGDEYAYAVRAAKWNEREQMMLNSGTHQRPVWAQERWWSAYQHLFERHYVHISLKDPTGIAFTEDERKGEADRQTFMRPGKYLQKFLGAGPSGLVEHGPLKDHEPVVSKMQIAYYAAWHQTGARPPTEDVLHFTQDEDEIVRVYDEGPPSCMSDKDEWAQEYHPVRVYAAGDLAVAYVTALVDNEVLSRALCWPEKKVFGRVYPTPNTSRDQTLYNDLMGRLKTMGWRSIEEDSRVFDGARLLRRTNAYDNWIMPYLDHDYGVRSSRDGAHWIMDRSEDHQDNTTGTYTETNTWTCECCEDHYSENVDHYTVYARWDPGRGYATGEMSWCESCRSHNSFYCEGSNESYEDGDDSIDTDTGYTYEAAWFRAHGGWQCYVTDKFYAAADGDPVIVQGEKVHEDRVEEHVFTCKHDGEMHFKEDESEAYPGFHDKYDELDPHPSTGEDATTEDDHVPAEQF